MSHDVLLTQADCLGPAEAGHYEPDTQVILSAEPESEPRAFRHENPISRNSRPPLPDVPDAGWHRCDAHRSGLLGGLRHPETDGGPEGHGFAFTIGRGNDICAAAIEAFRHHVVGLTLNEITEDFGGFWRRLASDSQLRWLGPEKGVVHLALAAIVNAVWDLYGKVEGKPVWKLLADMTPKQLVSCIDFRYITDVLTPEEAFEMLDRLARDQGRARSRAAADGLSGVHDVGRVAGLFGRQGARRLPRGHRRRLDPLQGQGRRRPGGRCASRRTGARRDRPGPDADDRRQPALGRRRSHRAHGRTSAGSTRSGSKSRRARTMSSGTPRSRARSSRSASRPASIARIA